MKGVLADAPGGFSPFGPPEGGRDGWRAVPHTCRPARQLSWLDFALGFPLGFPLGLVRCLAALAKYMLPLAYAGVSMCVRGCVVGCRVNSVSGVGKAPEC